MVIAMAAHEVDAGDTGRDAVEHQLDVRLLDVVATFGQAMTGQHVSTGRLALLAVSMHSFMDAVAVLIRFSFGISLMRPLCRCISGMQLAYHYGVY